MNKLITIILLMLLSSLQLIFAQTKQEILEQLRSNEYKEIERVEAQGEIYKITDKLTGHITYQNFSNIGQLKDSSYNTTQFILSELDTSLYTGMYYHWKDIDVYGSSGYDFIQLGDINKNGKLEIYGKLLYSKKDIREWVIYEFDSSFSSYSKLFQFPTEPDSICENFKYSQVSGIYDINRNGREQVYLRCNCRGSDIVGNIFSSENSNELPIHKDFEYHEGGQLNDVKFGDFDNDGTTDMVYFNSGIDKVEINKYDSLENNFTNTYISPTTITGYNAGFAIDDMDNNNYPEITFGNLWGGYTILEYSPNLKDYDMKFQKQLDTYNLYMHFVTNDIDGNGKKEFWAGGGGFDVDTPKTRLYCFENVEDDSFKIVHVIEITGLFSLDAFNGEGVDLDNDGNEELFLCMDNSIFIMKFTGFPNEQKYEIYYYSVNSFWGAPYYLNYMSATTYDLNKNGEKEILISQEAAIPGGELRGFTTIFTAYDPMNIKQNENKGIQYRLFNNYPNPFNPTTNIKYSISKESHVKLKVYNVLGEQVRTLVNEIKKPGNYEMEFNGSNLPSGIYFITIQAGKFTQAIKTILLK